MITKIRLSSHRLSQFFLLCFAIYGLVFLSILAQFTPNVFMLEMIASFLPHLVLLGIVSSILLALFDAKFSIIGMVLTLIAATPFLTFSQFLSPTEAECPPTNCLTVITANVFARTEATIDLLELAEVEGADVVAMNESINLILASEYRPSFAAYETVIHAAWENMPRHMGNPITLSTNQPLRFQDRVLRYDTGGRAYIIADLDGDWSGTRLVAAHAMTPVSRTGLRTRNALLSAAGEAAAESDSFILMGDFNLTPWTPAFRKLPGKRAGDPRFTSTWPVALGPFGIPIDHIMFSDDLELVEFKPLEPDISDHYPILARFRRKD